MSRPQTQQATRGPSLAERFAPREYVAGSQPVPVVARKDVLALRTPLDKSDVARVVEDAIEVLGADIRIAKVTTLRGGSSPLQSVELVDAVPRKLLVMLAERVELSASGQARVYPVLSRMKGRAFADEHLVVTAAAGQLARVVDVVLEKTGGAFDGLTAIPNTAMIKVGAPLAFDAVEASRRIAGTVPGLVSAEPDLVRELALKSTVLDDARFADQWHLSRQDDDVPGLGQIFADEAWNTTLGEETVTIAVFDSGIDIDHPDLVNKVVAAFDSVGTGRLSVIDNADGTFSVDQDSPSYDADPRPECTGSFDGRDITDSCPSSAPFRESHGTSVSGILGAEGDNGIDVAGVCPRCAIMAVRLLGDEAQSGLRIAEAFFHAVELGADVINNSWGPGFSVFFPLSQAERDAFEHARKAGRGGKGTIIVFAAGNDTADVASDAYASHPHVIAVAATSNMDDWAYYSNYGAQIDVAAPSQGPTDDRDGYFLDDFGIVTTDVEGDDGYDDGDVHIGFGGTSAASPVTAGVLGLVLSANPSLTAAQARLVLTSSADKIVADKVPWEEFFADDIAAIFAYDEVGHSIGFGFGRINAARAVERALTPPLTGASCLDPACTFCSANDVCLDRCEAQSDCVDGSLCTSIGACELPRERPSSFLTPCTSDCAWCTPTLDTEFGVTDICTRECASDNECPDGFDCRLTEEGGPSICGVGDKGAGNPNDFFSCFSPQIGTSVVVASEQGRQLCGDICFAADARADSGACPFGFHCASADCECTAPSNVGCFEFLCDIDSDPQPDESDFFFPVCLPNPGHADKCTSDVDCQLGDYCKKDSASPDDVGDCRLDDREGCDICATCADDADCLGRGVCIGTRDDGIGECSWACGDADPCPGDSVCREVEAQFGTLFVCLSPNGGAQPEDRCDSQYVCQVACRDDVACPRGFSCDAGTCVRDPIPDEPERPSCAAASAGSLTPLLLSLAALMVRTRDRGNFVRDAVLARTAPVASRDLHARAGGRARVSQRLEERGDLLVRVASRA